MSGSSASRRGARMLVALQVMLIVATLFSPIPVAATDEPPADPPPSSEPSPTPEPTPASTPVAAPTITSDKDDYAPGELVTLSGTNWAPGEAVHIFVNDDAGSTWNRHSDVVADEAGVIIDAFNLPTWFVAVYSVTATGMLSGTAVTSFTDARLVTSATLNGGSSVTVSPSSTINAGVSVTTDGSGANARWRSTSWLIATTAPVTVSAGNCINHADHDGAGSYSETVSITAPASTGTYHAYFKAHADDTCGGAGGGASALFTLTNGVTVQVTRTTTTTLSRTTGASPSVYGSPLTFTAAVTASGGNPSSVGTVTFKNGATVICNAVPLTGNSATCSPQLAVGSYNLTAEYSGATSGFVVFTTSTSSPTLSQSITPKNLTISGAVANNKTYNGTAAATVNFGAASLVGVVGSDVVSIDSAGYSASFNDASVGNGKPVTVTGVTLAGAAAGNYTVSQPTGLTANILPAGLTVDFSASDKTYDATAAASIVGCSLTGVIGSDDVDCSAALATASFADANSGDDKVVTGSGFTLTGTDATNYAITLVTTTTADIDPAALTISAVTDSKTYDGTTSSDENPTVSGLQGTDTVTGRTQAFVSKNVLGAAGSTLVVTAYTVNDGNGGLNYSVTTPTAPGTISPAALTISAVADSKTYDGTTSSDEIPTVSGMQPGDSVTGQTQAFVTKNALGVGGSTLSVTAYTVSDGNGGDNYTVATPTAPGTIDPAALAISAVTDSKTYDGTTSSDEIPTVSGLQPGDSVTGRVQAFASRDVLGVGGSTLTVTAYTVVDGNGGNNYTVATPTATGTISPAGLTVTASSPSAGIYGDAVPSITPLYAGFVPGENASVLDTLPTCSTTYVVGSSPDDYPTTCSGGADTNYELTYVPGNFHVNKKTLVVTADNKSKVFGAVNPPFTYQVTGFVLGQNASVIDTAPSCTTTATQFSPVGPYPVTCAGALDDNYAFTNVNGTLTIQSWTLYGFYQPVDMNGVYNVVKGGSTVPLKFQIFAGPTELTDTSAVVSVTWAPITCNASAPVDPIEEIVTTGGTELRYTGSQFIDNWKTPSKPGTCVQVTMRAADGSRLNAFFKLK